MTEPEDEFKEFVDKLGTDKPADLDETITELKQQVDHLKHRAEERKKVLKKQAEERVYE